MPLCVSGDSSMRWRPNRTDPDNLYQLRLIRQPYGLLVHGHLRAAMPPTLAFPVSP